MNIAIIDDEIHCIESLVIHLHALFPEMTIVYKSNKVQEAVSRLPDINPDLLFLDIEMPGLNGFQLLEHMPDRQFDVIFTTAYSQYAIQAFKAKACNYLLKPIDEQELKDAVTTWKKEKKNEPSSPSTDIDLLLDHLKKEGSLKSKISVPVSDGFEFIEVNNIMYCKSQSNYTTLFLVDGSNVMVSKTMKEVQKTLDHFSFVRVHQSHLINPNYMKKYYKNDGGYLVMQDQTSIPVSNQNRKLVVGIFEAIKRGEG